jgi:hypothetical protein
VYEAVGVKSSRLFQFSGTRKGGINMAVFRVEKTQSYTVMSNHHLRNDSLTLKAKGLLSQMLSLFSIRRLSSLAIRFSLKRLRSTKSPTNSDALNAPGM